MKKVYLVWQGEYSDRTVIAAFSKQEEAEKYAALKNELEGDIIGGCWVNPIELDKNKVVGDPKVVTYYSVLVWLSSNEYRMKGEIECEYDEKQIYTKDVNYKIDKTDNSLLVSSVKSFEHAKKCALDKFYELEAEESGLL